VRVCQFVHAYHSMTHYGTIYTTYEYPVQGEIYTPYGTPSVGRPVSICIYDGWPGHALRTRDTGETSRGCRLSRKTNPMFRNPFCIYKLHALLGI
jgi:hypothetical protein